MNPCTELAPLMSALIDGEASLDQRRLVEAHLPQCADCQKVYANLASVGEGLRGLEPPPLEAPLWRTPAAPAAASAPRWKQDLLFPLMRLLVSLWVALHWLGTRYAEPTRFAFWSGLVISCLTFAWWAQARGLLWHRMHRNEMTETQGDSWVEAALEPIQIPLVTVVLALLAGSLQPVGWPPASTILGCLPLLVGSPILGAWLAQLPRLVVLGGVGCLAGAVALHPQGGAVVCGLLAIRALRSDPQWRLAYSRVALLCDLSGLLWLSAVGALSHATDVISPLWLRNFDARQWQHWLGLESPTHWQFLAVWGWWWGLRAPLVSAAEIYQRPLGRAVVGLLAGLLLGVLSMFWLGTPAGLVGGALLGVYLGLTASTSVLPGERSFRLAFQLRLGGLLLCLSLLGGAWSLHAFFPPLPAAPAARPALLRGGPGAPAPSDFRDLVSHLSREVESLRLGTGFEQTRFRESKKQFLDRVRTLRQGAERPFPREVSWGLRALAQERQLMGDTAQAVAYALEAESWQRGGCSHLLTGFLFSDRLSADQLRIIVKIYESAPVVPSLDTPYEWQRAVLEQQELPPALRDYQIRVLYQFYQRLRLADETGAQLPDPLEFHRLYPGGALGAERCESLLSAYWVNKSWATEQELVYLLAAIQLHRLEHRRYPDRLEDLPRLPRNYLTGDGRFRYQVREGKWNLEVPGQLGNHPLWPPGRER